MAVVLNATIGSGRANSYLTHAEANAYFETRVPLTPAWVASGQDAALIMATRLLDALAQPYKTFVPGNPSYYRVRRHWTGAPATKTQRLAWPRVGMFDQNGHTIDPNIASMEVPDTIVTDAEHNLEEDQQILVFGSEGASPEINGVQAVDTVETDFRFMVSGGAMTTVGTGGKVTYIPQALKDATAELAGQLLGEDRTLDSDTAVKGIKSVSAGSVSVTFKDGVLAQVIPQSVYDMLPVGWLTEEIYESVQCAMFDVVSE